MSDEQPSGGESATQSAADAPAAPSSTVPGQSAADAPAAPSDPVAVVELPAGSEGEGPRVVHILGTAHVSRRSVEQVRALIERLRPDTVCVELDEMRYQALTDETRWRKLDIFQVIKQKKMLFLMASLALQAYQKRLGEKMGVRPGAELLAGAEAAREVGAEVVLADRDVQVTLRRTWANLGFFDKVKLLGALGASVFFGDEVQQEDIEALKDRETIGDMLTELARVMPQIKKPLIDERDAYLVSSIAGAPGKTLVAVVGAGHVQGMVALAGKPVDREALERMPARSRWRGLLKWLIPAIILAAFYWGYHQHAGEGLGYMLKAWVLPNAVVAGLFTTVAGGKPLSVLTAIVASPITSLNPTIAAGMVVGLVEAWLRRPTVEDCERLGREVTTFKGMFHNPFSRILIVAVAATLGSALGAYIGTAWVLTLL